MTISEIEWNKTTIKKPRHNSRHKTGNKQFCLGEYNNIICVVRKRKYASSQWSHLKDIWRYKVKKRQDIRQISPHTQVSIQDIINLGGFLEWNLQIAEKENQRCLRDKTRFSYARSRQDSAMLGADKIRLSDSENRGSQLKAKWLGNWKLTRLRVELISQLKVEENQLRAREAST